MKYLYIALALLLAAGGAVAQKQYSNVAYWSGRGESLVLLKEACQLPGYPAAAKKATYIANMNIVHGCWIQSAPDRVIVSMNGNSIEMTRAQFIQWDIK